MDQTVRTFIQLPLNGSTVEFDVPFEYLARKFVQVALVSEDNRKQLVLPTDYRFVTKTRIRTTNPWGPSQGFDRIEIRRFTSATERLVDFADGSILRATDLNIAQIQSTHIAEEARDAALLAMPQDDAGNLDALNRRIVRLAPGIDGTDAINKDQLDKTLGDAGGLLTDMKETGKDIMDYIQNFADDSTMVKGVSWVYNNGSAAGGETTFVITKTGPVFAVPYIEINGLRQLRGYHFEYDPTDKRITLAKPLVTGDFVVCQTAESSLPLADLLVGTSGASQIGTASGSTVQDELNDLTTSITGLPSIEALRNTKPRVNGQRVLLGSYWSGLNKGGGTFVYRAGSTAADDGGTIIVTKTGERWFRLVEGPLSVYWFGVKADGVSDDSVGHQAAQDAAQAQATSVTLHSGVSMISKTIIQKANTRGMGNNITIIKPLSGTYWDTLDTGLERNTGDIMTSSFRPMWQMGKRTEDTHVAQTFLTLSDLWLLGKASRATTRSADRTRLGWFGDGIHVANKCQFPVISRVRSELMQAGVNTYNDTGHIAFYDFVTASCFYSWWVDFGSGDYRFYNCDLVSAQFACIGLHGSQAELRPNPPTLGTTGAGGVCFYSCTLGFAPYTVYQKDSPDIGGGMLGWACFGTNSEANGNRMIRLGAGAGGNSNNIFWQGGFSFTQPLGSGNATAYQIQGDANHPIQPEAVSIPHTLSSSNTRSDLTGLLLNAGSTGFKVKIETLQSNLIINDAHQYVDVTTGSQRLVDPKLQPYMGITSIINGKSVGPAAQVISTLTPPVNIRRVPRMLCEFSVSFRAPSAKNGVVLKVQNQSGVDLGSATVDVPAGSSTQPVLLDFVPNGATTLNLVIVGAIEGTTLGSGLNMRVKWTAGFNASL